MGETILYKIQKRYALEQNDKGKREVEEVYRM